jgi:cell division transport system ATP-binding protein
MILLDRVSKKYTKTEGTALDRISLHVEPREFVIVVGQSGAGKTTLLKLLTREERPTSGKIVIGGIDYDKLKDKDIPLLRRKIGVVFQDFKLGKENRMPRELSGGERQRVAIARAIVRQPRILIADEPTGNLDPKHAWDVIKVLEKINKYGTTVLLTTHNQDIVNKLKRRVVTIQGGRIASDRANAGYSKD